MDVKAAEDIRPMQKLLIGSPFSRISLSKILGNDRREHWLHNEWKEIIRKYSRCELSIGSDKLVAISGLAQQVSRTLKLDPKCYLAGLWFATLPSSLLWQVNPNTYQKDWRRVADRAPSWSWACIDGEIEPPPLELHELRISNLRRCIQLLDAHTSCVDDPFGQVSGGCIRLQSALLQITELSDAKWGTSPKSVASVGVKTVCHIHWDDYDSQKVERVKNVYFLPSVMSGHANL
jgi:hypothetical protein